MASPFMGPLRVTGREMRVLKTLYCRFKMCADVKDSLVVCLRSKRFLARFL